MKKPLLFFSLFFISTNLLSQRFPLKIDDEFKKHSVSYKSASLYLAASEDYLNTVPDYFDKADVWDCNTNLNNDGIPEPLGKVKCFTWAVDSINSTEILFTDIHGSVFSLFLIPKKGQTDLYDISIIRGMINANAQPTTDVFESQLVTKQKLPVSLCYGSQFIKGQVVGKNGFILSNGSIIVMHGSFIEAVFIPNHSEVYNIPLYSKILKDGEN